MLVSLNSMRLFSPHLPVILQLLHGTVHLSHDVVGSALTADTKMPLGLFHCQRFGLGGVQGVQWAAGLGAVCQQWGHSLWVWLDVVVDEGASRWAGSQVELAGLVHDTAVVDDEVVGDGQLVLRVAAVQAAEHLGLGALKLLANVPHGFLVDHSTVIRRVFWEQVIGQILLKPFVFSVGTQPHNHHWAHRLADLTLYNQKYVDTRALQFYVGPQTIATHLDVITVSNSLHWN